MKCYVDPDEYHILSATDADAILLGNLDEDGERNEACVVYVPRTIYLAAIGDWLDRKADYANRWSGEWCGVGNINFSTTKIGGRTCHLARYLITPDDPEGFVDVSAWRATGEYDIDMEHG